MNEEFVDHDRSKVEIKSKDKIAALCFLFGSLLFTIDGIGYCIEHLTWHSLCYTSGSVLFLVGSGFMIL